MPRTASTRNTDRGLHNSSRPSSVARTASQSTPVLFRLPIVETSHDVSEVEYEESAPGNPLASKPIAGGDATASQPQVQSEVASKTTTTSAVAPPIVTSRLAEPLATVSSAPETQTIVAAESESSHGWWEHWSSGIVLILLIVALVAASVIALNDSGATRIEQMADGDFPSGSDFDLTNLQIPDIQATHSPTNVANNGPASPPGNTVNAVVNTSTELPMGPSSAVEQDKAPLENQMGAPPVVVGSSPAAGSQDASTNHAPLNNSLIVNEVEFPTLQTSSANANLGSALPATETANANTQGPANSLQAKLVQTAATPPSLLETKPVQPSSAQPLATLASPVGVPAPPLFSEPVRSQSDAGGLTVPTATVTRSTPASPSIQGESPSFYDGAASNASQQTAGNGDSPAQSMDGPVDTNMPPLSATLAGLSSMSRSLATRKPDTSAQVGPTAATSTSAASQDVGSAMPSATPDLDADAIVQAYLRFKALNKAQNMPSNRYQLSPEMPNPSNATTEATQFPLNTPAQGASNQDLRPSW